MTYGRKGSISEHNTILYIAGKILDGAWKSTLSNIPYVNSSKRLF